MSFRLLAVTALVLALNSVVSAQQIPDLLYYRFEEATGVGGTTQNWASPGVGSTNATVTGHSLTAGVGQFGGGLVAATPASNANFVDTGWVTALPNTGWTISFWADPTVATTANLHYVFGDTSATGFRCFYRGVAGTGCILRGGGLADCNVPNALNGGPHVVTFVYDSATSATYGYLDGVLGVTTTQPQNLAVSGTANFRVAGYGTATFGDGVLLDEFRIYSRALTAQEVLTLSTIDLLGAAVIPSGSSCSLAGGSTLVLTATGLPTLGNANFAFNIAGGVNGNPAFLFHAIGLEANPSAFQGCPVYLDVVSLFAIADTGMSPIGPFNLDVNGATTILASISNDLNMLGRRMDVQAVAFENVALGTTTTSNALTLHISF